MALVRWSPVTTLASMEIDRLNRMFSELYNESVSRGWTPSVDVYETDQHEVVIKADLPDMKREDIDVTFENGVLTLGGQRATDGTVQEGHYHRRERVVGQFTRSFTVPAAVDASRINAAYKDGVLTIRLPQREEAKPKQIAVGE